MIRDKRLLSDVESYFINFQKSNFLPKSVAISNIYKYSSNGLSTDDKPLSPDDSIVVAYIKGKDKFETIQSLSITYSNLMDFIRDKKIDEICG
jgi:hypothetical protein